MTDESVTQQIIPDSDPLLRQIRREFAAHRNNKARAEAKLQREFESQRRERVRRNELARARAVDTLVRSYRRALDEKFRGS
jgi:hypothetical protein